MVHGDSVGVWDGIEHGAPNCPSLGNLIFVPKANRFLWLPFGTGRGVTQGHPAFPMIFNIFVDAVVRATLEVVCGPQ